MTQSHDETLTGGPCRLDQEDNARPLWSRALALEAERRSLSVYGNEAAHLLGLGCPAVIVSAAINVRKLESPTNS